MLAPCNGKQVTVIAALLHVIKNRPMDIVHQAFFHQFGNIPAGRKLRHPRKARNVPDGDPLAAFDELEGFLDSLLFPAHIPSP